MGTYGIAWKIEMCVENSIYWCVCLLTHYAISPQKPQSHAVQVKWIDARSPSSSTGEKTHTFERWKILRCDKHLLRGLMDTFSYHNIVGISIRVHPGIVNISRSYEFDMKEKKLNEKKNNWYKKLINGLHVVIINCKWISILSFTLSRFSWLHFLLKLYSKST